MAAYSTQPRRWTANPTTTGDTRVGRAAPAATVAVHSADALRRMLTAPGQLGFARAHVAGDIDLVGEDLVSGPTT